MVVFFPQFSINSNKLLYCKHTKHISKINSNSSRLMQCKYTIHIIDKCVNEFEKRNLQGFNIQNI